MTRKIFFFLFCLAHVLPNITEERLVTYTAVYQQGAIYMFWLHFELSLVDRDWQRVLWKRRSNHRRPVKNEKALDVCLSFCCLRLRLELKLFSWCRANLQLSPRWLKVKVKTLLLVCCCDLPRQCRRIHSPGLAAKKKKKKSLKIKATKSEAAKFCWQKLSFHVTVQWKICSSTACLFLTTLTHLSFPPLDEATSHSRRPLCACHLLPTALQPDRPICPPLPSCRHRWQQSPCQSFP